VINRDNGVDAAIQQILPVVAAAGAR